MIGDDIFLCIVCLGRTHSTIYRWRQEEGEGGTWKPRADIKVEGSSRSSHIVNLKNGRTYQFQVQCHNANGAGDISTFSNSVTPEPKLPDGWKKVAPGTDRFEFRLFFAFDFIVSFLLRPYPSACTIIMKKPNKLNGTDRILKLIKGISIYPVNTCSHNLRLVQS
jgi:hypothetical protein